MERDTFVFGFSVFGDFFLSFFGDDFIDFFAGELGILGRFFDILEIVVIIPSQNAFENYII